MDYFPVPACTQHVFFHRINKHIEELLICIFIAVCEDNTRSFSCSNAPDSARCVMPGFVNVLGQEFSFIYCTYTPSRQPLTAWTCLLITKKDLRQGGAGRVWRSVRICQHLLEWRALKAYFLAQCFRAGRGVEEEINLSWGGSTAVNRARDWARGSDRAGKSCCSDTVNTWKGEGEV